MSERKPDGPGRPRKKFNPADARALGVNPEEYNPSDWVICTAPGSDGEPCGARRKKEWLSRQPCAACGTWWEDVQQTVVQDEETERKAAAAIKALFLGL